MSPLALPILSKRSIGLMAAAALLCGGMFVVRRHLPFYSWLRSAGPVALLLTGRSDGCELASVLKLTERQAAQSRTAKQISGASRLLETDASGFEHWDTPRGRFWIPPENGIEPLAFMLSLEQNGFYDGKTARIGQGDIVLDCGAHVGVFTRKALAAGAQLVVAVEPAPANLTCLRRTFADEIAKGRVIVHGEGVWDQTAVLPMHFDRKDSMRSSIVLPPAGPVSEIDIHLTTIDSLASRLKLARVDYLKVHVEGAEMKAIAGARQTIRSHKPRIAVSPFHLKDDQRDIPAFIRSVRADYSMECGPCIKEYDQLRPEMLFFQ
jgi:FkbM family methyltransferase